MEVRHDRGRVVTQLTLKSVHHVCMKYVRLIRFERFCSCIVGPAERARVH